MDSHSVQTAPILDASTKLKRKKFSKREKKLFKKKRKFMRKHGNKKHYFEPIDKSKSITLHLVHRSTNDPLLDICDNNNEISEWVLEPEVKNRNDFQRIQKFFSEFELEDTIPHHYRTDEFIEKTSAKSMPILPYKYKNDPNNYNYDQHYRSINDSNFMEQKVGKNNKNKNNDQLLEQYIFEQDYENEFEDAEEYDADGNYIQKDANYQDYIELLDSDNDEKCVYEYVDDAKMTGDLQDDFVFRAMGMSEQTSNKRVQVGDFEPYGARFAKWNEMDVHYDKFYKNNNYNNSDSLYDKTINHLMNIQNAKDSNLSGVHGHGQGVNELLEAISEEDEGQFMDAEEEDYEDSDDDSGHGGGIVYDPNKSLLDNQFEIMLNKEYNDDFIGELDDDLEELRDFNYELGKRFGGKNKKDSLRYQYYMYLKNKKRRIRCSLRKSNRNVTLQLMGVDLNSMAMQTDVKNADGSGDESDEIIFFSDSDSEKDDGKVNYQDLDSDDERRINAEIDEEFKKKEKDKWDVESILSTRTNHENHPMEIKVNIGGSEKGKVKSGLESILEHNCDKIDDNCSGDDDGFDIEFAFGNIGGGGGDIIKEENGNGIVFEFKKFDDVKDENMDMDLNVGNDVVDGVNDDGNDMNGINAYGKRKGESKEEKKLRKQLQKEMKQKRRKEKKANKDAFKQARKKQSKLTVTQRKSHGNAIRL